MDSNINPDSKGYRELLVEVAERGTSTSAQRKNKYLKLVEASNGDPSLKKRLIRIGKVLDDWELIKLHLFLTPSEVKYLEGLKLSPNETYFVQAADRLQLNKFKSYYLLMDGTDLMPNVVDLSTLVLADLGRIEELSTEDVERGISNLNIIYIRKNMGLMGRSNDLYINQLLNHVSFRRSKGRKTLILSEVMIKAIVDSGEVRPIIITNDNLRTSTGKPMAINSLTFAPASPKEVPKSRDDGTSQYTNRSEEYEKKVKANLRGQFYDGRGI